MADDKDKLLFDLLKEVREVQRTDSEKIRDTAIHVSIMKNDLEKVKKETATNTQHMGEHISRTEIAEQGLDILKDLHADNQKRIEHLEEDAKKKDQRWEEFVTERKVKKTLKENFKENLKYWLTIGGLAITLATKIAGLW